MDAPPAPDPAAEDFYARLGVPRDAPADAVRAAYREAVRRHPPERDAEAFKRVREAFETLSDESLRAEYDLLHDDGSPAALLAQAERAMNVRDWAAAEPLLKRVLIEDPEAGRPRNMLALCFLHREQPGPAATQYDRLLARPDADVETVWLTNAGHAYRQSNRPEDARRAVLRAAARPDADQAECAVTLADLAMDARDAKGALAALADGAKRVAADQPGAAALALREVDVHLATADTIAYGDAVGRAEAAARRAGWEQQGAYRLGIVAWRLVEGEAFDLALTAAEAARRLQPDDLDYDAQVDVATALGNHDLSRARQLVRTHVAFAPGRWLPRLGQRVVEYCDRHQAFDGMRRIKGPPSLFTVNGTGTRLAGRAGEDEATRSYVSTLFACVFFIPVLPLARYRVQDGEKRGWVFLGRLPLTTNQRVWLVAAALLVALVALTVSSRRERRPERAAEAAPAVNTTSGATPSGGAPLRVMDPEHLALGREIKERDARLEADDSALVRLRDAVEAERVRVLAMPVSDARGAAGNVLVRHQLAYARRANANRLAHDTLDALSARLRAVVARER